MKRKMRFWKLLLKISFNARKIVEVAAVHARNANFEPGTLQ